MYKAIGEIEATRAKDLPIGTTVKLADKDVLIIVDRKHKKYKPSELESLVGVSCKSFGVRHISPDLVVDWTDTYNALDRIVVEYWSTRGRIKVQVPEGKGWITKYIADAGIVTKPVNIHDTFRPDYIPQANGYSAAYEVCFKDRLPTLVPAVEIKIIDFCPNRTLWEKIVHYIFNNIIS